MFSLNELSKLVNDEIQGLYQNREPKGLYQPIDYALESGGKRIRPVLCLMASQMFSNEIKTAMQPALALEIFHNFTLLHDDIMDQANVRRHKPTVHVKWDVNTAILSGDAMMIEAYEHFWGLEPQLMAKVLPVFNQMAREVCEGQQYDMNFETQKEVSEAEYIEMIRLKTAVFLAAALKIGAYIGEANETEADKLYRFGIELGLAFQIQDDYLDTFGNEATFGKKIGGDIVENKRTFLLINALAKDLSGRLKSIIEMGNLERESKIHAVSDIYRLLGVDKLSQNKALQHYQNAFDILETIDLDQSKKEPLKQFVEKLKSRIF